MKRTLKTDRKVIHEKEVGRYNQKMYKDALLHIDQLEAELAAVKKLQAAKRTHIIKPSANKGVDEATVVAVLSDVHVGEEILPKQVQGLNEYNMAIAKKRLDQFFRKVARLADKERQDVTIKELVLCIIGDIIDGSLHLDTIMGADMAQPMKQAVFAQECIESGLKFLEDRFEKITIVWKDGN